jgi:hypothetical protein
MASVVAARRRLFGKGESLGEGKRDALDLRACTHKSSLVSSGWSTSALPPEADIRRHIEHVR